MSMEKLYIWFRDHLLQVEHQAPIILKEPREVTEDRTLAVEIEWMEMVQLTLEQWLFLQTL